MSRTMMTRPKPIDISIGCRYESVSTRVGASPPAVVGSNATSHPLHDRQAANAVEQVDQPAIIHREVVARHALGALWHVGHEVRDLARRMRVLHVDDAQALRKPRERDLGAGHLLAGLVAAGHDLLPA